MRTFYANAVPLGTLKIWKACGQVNLDTGINLYAWLIRVSADELRRRESSEAQEPTPANPPCERWDASEFAQAVTICSAMMTQAQSQPARDFLHKSLMIFTYGLLYRVEKNEPAEV